MTVVRPDPNVYDPAQRDFYAHPLNAYGRCIFLQSGAVCPPPIDVEAAILSDLTWEYLSPYAVNVVGITIPPEVTTIPALVPLILTGLGYANAI